MDPRLRNPCLLNGGVPRPQGRNPHENRGTQHTHMNKQGHVFMRGRHTTLLSNWALLQLGSRPLTRNSSQKSSKETRQNPCWSCDGGVPLRAGGGGVCGFSGCGGEGGVFSSPFFSFRSPVFLLVWFSRGVSHSCQRNARHFWK